MKTIILDDERGIIDSLRSMIRDISSDETACYTQVEEMLLDLEEGRIVPELIFMDIKLGKVNGIDLAAKVLQDYPETQIVFISGYDDFYLDVYDVEHIYFLRKPITAEQLKKAYDKAASKRAAAGQQYFEYRFRQSSHIVPYRDILYFENDGRKVILYAKKEDGILGARSGSMAKSLDEAPVNEHTFYETVDEVFARLDSRSPCAIDVDGHLVANH